MSFVKRAKNMKVAEKCNTDRKSLYVYRGNVSGKCYEICIWGKFSKRNNNKILRTTLENITFPFQFELF